MLRNVEALDLNVLRHTQPHCDLHAHEEGGCAGDAPHDDDDGAHGLHPKLLPPPASVVDIWVTGVLDVGVGAEDARREHSPQPAQAVDGERVEGVVYAEAKEEVVGVVVNYPTDAADNESHPRVNHSAVRSDRDETGEDAVQAHANVKDPLNHPGDDDAGERGGSPGDGGGHSDLSCNVGSVARHSQGGPAVESVPAKPEDKGAERHQRRVVVLHVLGLAVGVEAAQAGPDDDGANQAAPPAYHVAHARPGKINHAVGGVGA
mmetsp:Transcript_23662/g.55029  ORF Transcript_23662/g.55029 Transcript_23662/m.55029 type:complete len:262 (+) Transcript_23662:546-1331(+)